MVVTRGTHLYNRFIIEFKVTNFAWVNACYIIILIYQSKRREILKTNHNNEYTK
jgi:hypothetical protein